VVPARVGRREISAPGLDGAERAEVAKTDIEGAVAAGGKADERATGAAGDGAKRESMQRGRSSVIAFGQFSVRPRSRYS
jgi:hypothetical protein